ncbi:unnamed protein product [Auanema sp. JU1783]|nr:unnamed protein product [Auanema sp. JU1783]
MQTKEAFLSPTTSFLSKKRIRPMNEKEASDMRNRRRLAVQKHRQKIKDSIVKLEGQLTDIQKTNKSKEKVLNKLKDEIHEKISKIIRDPDLLQKTMQALQQSVFTQSTAIT